MSEETEKDNRTKKDAAEGKEGQKREIPDDGTDSTTWDTDQHSDAPGPFGTGCGTQADPRATEGPAPGIGWRP